MPFQNAEGLGIAAEAVRHFIRGRGNA